MLRSAHFRSATQDDIQAVCDLYLTSRKRFLPYAPLAHADAAVCGWMAETLFPHAQLSVAVIHGEIVGMMALTRTPTAGWIDQLYLHPHVVGQGIGSQFVAQAKVALGSPIRLYTFQANAGARQFYERHGFRAIVFGDGSQNEENCPDVLYEWQDAEVIL